MGGATAGARLGKSKEEGEKLLKKFFTDFSGLKKAIDDSKTFLKANGYVEDFLGRRRRLSEIKMDPYSVELKNKETAFNPFINCLDRDADYSTVAFWNQVLDCYCLLSNMNHIANELYYPEFVQPWEVNNEVSQPFFEVLKNSVGLNPSKYYETEKVKTIKLPSGTFKYLTGLEKLEYDMRRAYELIVNRKYTTSIVKRDSNGEPVVYANKQGEERKSYLESITFDVPSKMDDKINNYIKKYGINVPTNFKEHTKPVIFQAWTGKIAKAERQCFNARIQGSAASLTKLAMIDIYNDPVLNQCKTKLIIPVHDELLVECPEEYADIVEKRLPEVMINAAKRGGDDVKQACDPYNVTRWYCDAAAATIMDEFKKLEAGNKDKGIPPMSRDEALEKVIKNHEEVPETAIIKTIETGCDLDF